MGQRSHVQPHGMWTTAGHLPGLLFLHSCSCLFCWCSGPAELCAAAQPGSNLPHLSEPLACSRSCCWEREREGGQAKPQPMFSAGCGSPQELRVFRLFAGLPVARRLRHAQPHAGPAQPQVLSMQHVRQRQHMRIQTRRPHVHASTRQPGAARVRRPRDRVANGHSCRRPRIRLRACRAPLPASGRWAQGEVQANAGLHVAPSTQTRSWAGCQPACRLPGTCAAAWQVRLAAWKGDHLPLGPLLKGGSARRRAPHRICTICAAEQALSEGRNQSIAVSVLQVHMVCSCDV